MARQSGITESIENAEGRLLSLLNRLEGKPDAAQLAGQTPKPAFDRPKLLSLQNTLISFALLEPHARG